MMVVVVEVAGAGFPLSAVRIVPGDASSVFRRDTEAFSGAPGSTGAAPACIDLSELLLWGMRSMTMEYTQVWL